MKLTKPGQLRSFAAYPRCSASNRGAMKDPGDARGFHLGTYRRALRHVPALEVGTTRQTMQAEYRILSPDTCRFWTRFPWVFPRGERPPEYKGVAGETPIFFTPFGLAKWSRGEFVAEGYFPRWSVLLWGMFSLFFLLIGLDAAWRSYGAGGAINFTLSLAPGILPCVIGAYWWNRESWLFRAIAEEVADDLERENRRDAEQGVAADER
jgi:hypothetical protein